MAKMIQLNTFTDERGSLSVIEKEIGFSIKRVFYIYNSPKDIVRGEHRHKVTRQALITVSGSCQVYSNNGESEQTFLLESPSQCLIIEPEDWIKLYEFSNNAVLLVLASELFDTDDYIHAPYEKI